MKIYNNFHSSSTEKSFFTEFKQCYKIIPVLVLMIVMECLEEFLRENDVQLTKLTNFVQLETHEMHQEVNQ